MPGSHTFFNRVIINYTETACEGSWSRNSNGARREFHHIVEYNRLSPGAAVRGCGPDIPDVYRVTPRLPPWGQAPSSNRESTALVGRGLPQEGRVSGGQQSSTSNRMLSRSRSTPDASSSLRLQHSRRGRRSRRRRSAPGNGNPVNNSGQSQAESETDNLEWPALLSGLLSDEPSIP